MCACACLFMCVLCYSVCVLVPVALGVLVERGEHDGEDLGRVVADQTHDVLVVPVVQSPLSHLHTHLIIIITFIVIISPLRHLLMHTFITTSSTSSPLSSSSSLHHLYCYHHHHNYHQQHRHYHQHQHQHHCGCGYLKYGCDGLTCVCGYLK